MDNKIFGFCQGKTVLLNNISDPVFSEKMLGDGIAIYPNKKSKFITAPFDGVINLVSNTKHAVGITTTAGNEFLIHIGLETVELKGEGFTPLVEINQEVKAGTPLMEVDWDIIDNHSLDKSVMLVNCDYSITAFEYHESDEVQADTVVLEF